MPEVDHEARIECVSAIVAAYVSHNAMPAHEVPALIASVHQSLGTLGQPTPAVEQKPAVPIDKSITEDRIICLEDGKKFKSLKRHLAALGLTPDAYRKKWGLPADYPMVAPAYAAVRSGLAKQFGLGTGRSPRLSVVS